MGKKTRKTNTAFLSFASPDEKLAEALDKLLSLVGEHAYYAPNDLGEAGTPKWREEIKAQIKDSHSIVPIYTRNSIGRPWVLYESGIADAYGLERFPAHVSSVSIEEIDYLPSERGTYFDLSDKDGVERLLMSVCLVKGGDRIDIAAKVGKVCRKNERLVKQIVKLAKKRWGFIAGSAARDEDQLRADIRWYTTQDDYLNRLKVFCELLTHTLLNNGFSITACPQVKDVGQHVTEKALGSIAAKDCDDDAEFRIGGIYPIDRAARDMTLSEPAKREWLNHILDFRGTYLKDQEWLVLVGGNEGTQDEFEAATKYRVKTYAVPCFGGTAMRVFEQGLRGFRQIGPCAGCPNRDGNCGKDGIDKVVDCLKKVLLAKQVGARKRAR